MATVDLTTGAEASAPRGRRKFTDELDVALLKEVSAHNAHTSRRGESGHLFDAVAKSLNETRVLPWITDGKHCADRFNLIMRLFKQKDRAQRAASGEEDLYGEKEQLMDDMMSAIDDANEERRVQRAEASRRDEELRDAGEAVRAQAMARRRQNGPGNSGNVSTGTDDEPSSPHDDPVHGSGQSSETGGRRKRKREDSGAEWMESLVEIEERRLGQESARLRLETDRLQLERDKFTSNDIRESERFSFQQAQFNAQTEMQLKMINVLDRMIAKLQLV